MPITIAPPLLDQPTGPGFFAAWETDLIGPIEAGSSWSVTFRTVAAPETVQYSYTIGTDQHQFQGMFSAPGNHIQEVMTQSALPANQPARMVVELLNSNFQVVDSGAKQVVWDPVSGLHSLLSLITSVPADTGFTSADRAQLAGVAAATVANFLPGGGLASVAVQLGKFFAQPPLELLSLQDTPLLLTGRGSLQRPAGGLQVEAYGAKVRIASFPVGAGMRLGVVDEFELRVAQIAVVGRHGNTTTFLSTLFDLNYGGHYLRWPAPFPRRIDYDITPGFVLEWTWLAWGIQP